MKNRYPASPYTPETHGGEEGLYNIYLNKLWAGDKIHITTISEQEYEVTILEVDEQITGLLKRVDEGEEFEQRVELRGVCADVKSGENGSVRPIDVQAGYMQRWNYAYFGYDNNGQDMGLVTSRIDKIFLEADR